MTPLEIVFLLCVAVSFAPCRCETKGKEAADGNGARLPEFLSELDLASLEASEEDVEALKKVVKRLAPEKNVFFGNEELLREWLKGAGVTGQPGVDFPALTTIPATSFNCRGLKGGYYADLETNCQVFHICDNGRKISFLCPNGTIFQQSQLICDWWFKVDCSKSTELYEQSAEQLAEEERKRADAKRMKSEFHRASDAENARSFGDYDGRQNGRMNPYGQSPKQNQIQDPSDTGKPQFGQPNAFDQQHQTPLTTARGGQFAQNEKQGQPNDFDQRQQSYRGSYQPSDQSRQSNRLVDAQNDKQNTFTGGSYEHRGSGKFHGNNQDYEGTLSGQQDRHGSSGNEKPGYRSAKSRSFARNSSNNPSSPVQKVTPAYTETTTFRTSTASPAEFQQLAESAAFASNRGNRFNGNAHHSAFYYQSYNSRASNSEHGERESSTFSPANDKSVPGGFKSRILIPPFPGPTFAPIYKPRTTTVVPHETTARYATTTADGRYRGNDYYRQEYAPETTYATDDSSAVTVTPYPANQDYQTSTESYVASYNENGYQQDRGEQKETGSSTERGVEDSNYHGDRVAGRDDSGAQGFYPTARSYVNTETYRQNVALTGPGDRDYNGATAAYLDDRDSERTASRGTTFDDRANEAATKAPVGASSQSHHRQNSIGASTEKLARSTQTYHQNGSGGKTLSPYDTSFTYKQGKVMSTLGPYVPFTKNYIYSAGTGTTAKPPVYTATVPSYGTTASANHRATANSLIPRIRPSSTSSTRSKTGSAGYLPDSRTRSSLDGRPVNEREHALGMLHSLQGLNGDAPSLTGSAKKSEGAAPSSSGPSTLHSLALYFATASDNFDSNETTDSAVGVEYRGGEEDSGSSERNASVELPTSILTRQTVSSYAELFKLNDALENGTVVGNRLNEEEVKGGEEANDDDLDIQQSEGPLQGARRSNSTKLRELAQVFTHALSAYLQDPDTFKKVLTEIRPTEPPTTTESDQWETTTLYPTTVDEYPSVTKEKDEVLDFSDDSVGSRRRKPTTVYPTTIEPSTTTAGNTYRPYYTTSRDYYTTAPTTAANTRYPTTTQPSEYTTYSRNDGRLESSSETTDNAFAYEVNRAFASGLGNDVRAYSGEPSGPNGPGRVYDNYFPADYGGSENRIGGFQNNTASTFEPYGKRVKPFDATPISDNYVASSTPASYGHDYRTISYDGTSGARVSGIPEQELTPPFYRDYASVDGGDSSGPAHEVPEVSNSLVPGLKALGTTPIPKRSYEESSTSQPFRIRYFDTPATSRKPASGSYVSFRNYNLEARTTERSPATTTVPPRHLDPVTTAIGDSETTPRFGNVRDTSSSGNTDQVNLTTTEYSNVLSDDHWTSSPAVTQLWETTVFIDPKRINHGLESNGEPSGVTRTTLGEFTVTERSGRSTTPSLGQPGFATDASGESFTADSPTPWQWAPNNDDSPTAFTLLPAAYDSDNTATPSPSYTTRSSITTTITSSVTSTGSLPQDGLSTLLPYPGIGGSASNATENEILKAHEMFGKLNASSSSALMRAMKQADSNESVRRLVLLLISHCNGPANKTTEEEREQLIAALLRTPVNEFTSAESREIVAGINRLSLSGVGSRSAARGDPARTRSPSTVQSVSSSSSSTSVSSSTSPTSSTQPSVTTFRSGKGRKFRTTTENAPTISRRSDELDTAETSNSLSDEETASSDGRALELLRSLYSVAAKWG